MFDKIITLVSVCVSGLAVLATVFNAIQSQALEKEKLRLEIYSRFVAYCQKKASGTSTPEDDFELMKAHKELMLVIDYKFNDNIDNLYKHLFSEPRSPVTILLLDKVIENMRLELKKFNHLHSRSRHHQ